MAARRGENGDVVSELDRGVIGFFLGGGGLLLSVIVVPKDLNFLTFSNKVF
jgi:hypothetical protein